MAPEMTYFFRGTVPIKRLRLIATSEHVSMQLGQVLSEWLPAALGRPVSKAKVRKLIMAGAVRLNGRPVRNASKTVVPGAAIEAYIDQAKLFADSTSRDRPFEPTAAHILFEDDDLIVIDKPPGLPSQPTVNEARDNLLAALTRFLSTRDRTAEPYVGVHHRLDRDTSGVVLFTRSPRVNAAVEEMFSNHQILKIYQALTVAPREPGPRNKLDRQWTVKNHLGKIPSKSKRAMYGAVHSDGVLAETSFRVIAEYPRGVWIEAVPKTGRTHQIRVHLAGFGLPILGDDLYGADNTSNSDNVRAPRLMLHASGLKFPHPITGREICVKSPLPGDFKECLERIEDIRNTQA
jgi:RluA family pseudouridine synthase